MKQKPKDGLSQHDSPFWHSDSVSMLTLDRELAKHVELARKYPVPVERYGVPWVWIVAHPLWVAMDHLVSFVPQHHALVALRESIDDVLARDDLYMQKLGQRCVSGISVKFVVRAWLLQLLYSVATPLQVREALDYNLLWRWFVGYVNRSEPLPAPGLFAQDMLMVSSDVHVLEMVFDFLRERFPKPRLNGFQINYGLLNGLRAHHVGLDVMQEDIVNAVDPLRREISQDGFSHCGIDEGPAQE